MNRQVPIFSIDDSRIHATRVMAAGLSSLGTALLHPRLDIDFMRLMLVGQEVSVQQTLISDESLTFTASVSEFDKLEVGTFFSVNSDVRNGQNEVIGQIQHEYLMRSSGASTSSVEHWIKSRQHPLDGPLVSTRQINLRPEQMKRYISVSGDMNPIYSDHDFARMNGHLSALIPGTFLLECIESELGPCRYIQARPSSLAHWNEPLEIMFQRDGDTVFAALSQKENRILTAKMVSR